MAVQRVNLGAHKKEPEVASQQSLKMADCPTPDQDFTGWLQHQKWTTSIFSVL